MHADRPRLAWMGQIALLWLGLILARQLTEPTWEPGGPDWDSWYSSALAFLEEGAPYPTSRWPLYGGLAAALSLLTPGPLHLATTMLSLLAHAVATRALWGLCSPLLGRAGALVAALLYLSLPLTWRAAQWTSGYGIWLAGVALAAWGCHRAWSRPWPQELGLLGLGLALCLGALEKGVAAGGAFGLLGLALALRRGPRLPRLLWLCAPPLLLALAFAAFPYRLMSLDTQMQLPGRTGADPAQGEMLARLEGSTFTEGYVFGQSMGPATLLQTLERAQETLGGGPGQVEESWRRLRRAFPGLMEPEAGLPWALALAALVLLALRPRRRSFAALAALLLAGLTTLPALKSTFNLRFLLPAALPFCALLVAPLALAGALLSRLDRRLRWAPALLLPLAWLPGTPWKTSPWLHGDDLHRELLSGGADIDLQLWYDMERLYPGRRVHVLQPLKGGLLLLDGRGGRFLDPNQPLDSQDVGEQDLLLAWQDQRDPALQSDRPVLHRWRREDNRARGWLLLLGPRGGGGAEQGL